MLHLVLVSPEIPQNTGNIARTCAVTGCVLHLVGPLGFEIDDRKLKRAGLDYWHLLDIRRYDSLAEYLSAWTDARRWYATTKGCLCYTDAAYADGDHILFGRETAGLPEDLLKSDLSHCIRIPQISEARSLNLSNSVAIVAYEALRQLSFPGMQRMGSLVGDASGVNCTDSAKI